MAHRIVDETSLKTVADAIREKAGTSDSLVFPTGFAEAIAGIQAGGGSEGGLLNSVLARSETSYNLSGVTKVGDYAFYNFATLESLTLPDCEEVGGNFVNSCPALQEFNAPKLKTINSYAFNGGSTYPIIETLDLPELTTIGGYAFQNMKQLKVFKAPKLKNSLSYSIFSGCTALEFADLGLIGSMGNWMFTSCSSLATLVFRNTTSVCSMPYANHFGSTQLAAGGTGGTIYVPSALIESYKTATNWSALYAEGNCTFVALEGSEYE